MRGRHRSGHTRRDPPRIVRSISSICLAVGLSILSTLACSLPGLGDGDLTGDDRTAVPPSTEQGASPGIPASPTPPSLDPLEVLDTYPSLSGVREHLGAMRVTFDAGGPTMDGRQALEWLLDEWGYDPAVPTSSVGMFLEGMEETSSMSGADRIFLLNLATGLIAEARGYYPWSLAEYDEVAIRHLFIEDDTIQSGSTGTDRGDLPVDMPNTRYHTYPVLDQVIEQAHWMQFNLARRLTRDAATQEEAVAAIVVWLQQNFFHAISPGYGWEVYLDGRTPRDDGGPVAYPISLDRIYEERVAGCHEPTILLEGMLHSLNIPAMRLSMHGHGVLYLPTLDRYVHGDHVVAYTDAPPGMLMLTPEEIRPFADDVSWIYAIVYPDKYVSPLGSLPLVREGGDLFIQLNRAFDHQTGTCRQVGEAEWQRIDAQLEAFNLTYDLDTCEVRSDRIPILSLSELNTPLP